MNLKYEFKTEKDVLKISKKYNIPISEVAKLYEAEISYKKIPFIRNKMKKTRDTMYEAIRLGLRTNKKSKLGISGGDANKLYNSFNSLKNMLGNKMSIRAMAYALAISEQNACMGRIIAFPTAGGAGVIPGVLFSYSENLKAGKRALLRGLFCASAIGLIISEGATLSAAKGGCQAEIGAATAMAAAGVTEMRGGTPEQCFHAASIALKSYLGLVCDPLGGLVEVPCIKRNAIGCMSAIGASDMAIVGIKSFVSFDEVVEAMKSISKIMSPKLRETALGGLAITKTGNMVKKKLGVKITK